MIFSVSCAMIVCMVMALGSDHVISIYGAGDNVQQIANMSLFHFAGAFFCAWMQCSLGGIIKGTGQQGAASFASMFAIVAVGLPASYTFGLKWEMGLPGLWIGYGLSNIVLTILYLLILCTMDWKAAAELAAEDELENGESV